jgi:uncharacterized phage-associated protein
MAKLFDVAGFFLDYSQKTDEAITNMRLNKLLYFAYGLHLSRTGESLFNETIEAWEFGPVVPDVYHRYKSFREHPIGVQQIVLDRNDFSEQEYESLIETARLYGKYVTSALVSISHAVGGAWDVTIQNSRRAIPNELIVKEFENHSSSIKMDESLYDRLVSTVPYTADGIPILPREDDDDDSWPEYDDM